MLFFFGIGTTTISTQRLEGLACHYCGTLGALLLTIYSRYLHLFWIPVIPLGKQSLTQCTHCQQQLREGQMPPAYRQAADQQKQRARLPISNYLVLAIMGGLLAVVAVIGAFSDPVIKAPTAQSGAVVGASSQEEKEEESAPAASEEKDDTSQNAARLAAPQPDDQYVVRYANGTRLGLRVVRVTLDSLYLKGSSYQLASAAEALARPDSLRKHELPETNPMLRTDLQKMSEAGILTIVRR
ncbi:zinc-ribbon domain-containing protein [Hymenobacter psoromatis]|uniref:zinc-ribbon domain-containing protein n=1 Tax=Hymenobacter psoromatis TaxID=1484116 RepID=UPI001CC0E350|nr:zinc-ribbon domain-containing protein [Hymenobacter psoromatis]